MTIGSVLSHPLFPIISGALGALLGYVAKSVLDIWTTEVKRRQELGTHVMGQIETAAPSYYLMSNYAYLLSLSLNQYVETKRHLQIAPLDDTDAFSPIEYLTEEAKEISKAALFDVGKLYRIITKRFWIEGSGYFLPDKWASTAIEDLHNNLMSVVSFDSIILLKYIQDDTEQREFYEKLTAAENGVKEFEDLRDEYARYQDWLLKQDEQVKEAAVYAQAYSDLFDQQMKKLYKDWFDRGLLRRKSPDDPREADEIRKSSSPLLEMTRVLIDRSARKRASDRERKLDIFRDVTADPKVVDSNRHLTRGWNYYIARQYDLALQEYKMAEAKQPSNAFIYNQLGNAYLSMKDYANSASNYNKAIRLAPETAAFHNNLGRMQYKHENYEEAAKCYEQAAILDPSDFYYRNDLGNAYYGLKNWDRAVQAYSQAIALNPLDATLFTNLADAYREQGRYEAAVGAYDQAQDLKDDDPDTWNSKGVALHALTRYTEALDAYDKAVNLKDDEPTFLRNRGLALDQLNRHEEALEAYDESLSIKDDEPDTWNAKGDALNNLGRYDEASKAYDQARVLESN